MESIITNDHLYTFYKLFLSFFSLIFHYRFVIFFIAQNHSNLLRFDILSSNFIDMYSMLSIFQNAFTI